MCIRDSYSTEQPTSISYELDHLYGLSIVSCSKGEKLSDCVPYSYKEAINLKFANVWKDAMKTKIDALLVNDIWDVVLKPKSRLMSTCWVCTMKTDGENEFAKARLTARGFEDRKTYSELEIYLPVVSMIIIRWLFSVVNYYNLHMFQCDVRNAFLYGELTR